MSALRWLPWGDLGLSYDVHTLSQILLLYSEQNLFFCGADSFMYPEKVRDEATCANPLITLIHTWKEKRHWQLFHWCRNVFVTPRKFIDDPWYLLPGRMNAL